jgi:4-aminobutyrate aminotransferase-like enzyme
MMTTDTPSATESDDASSPARSARGAARVESDHDLVVDRGEGSWLVTTDGARYLDYTSGSA